MLVPLAALPLHRIELLGIVEDTRRRSLGLRTETHGISLLAELFHCSMLDQHRDEVAHGPVLQPTMLDADDMPNMLSRERREPSCETIDDVFKILVLIKPIHFDSLQRTPTRDNHRSVNVN